jgi:hypothetical protein
MNPTFWTCKSRLLDLISKDLICELNILKIFDLAGLVSQTFSKYSQTCPNDHLRITATCQQRPDLSHNDQPTTGLFQSTLCVTTTFFRSQGWPLYTGLTVYDLTQLVRICIQICIQNQQSISLDIYGICIHILHP